MKEEPCESKVANLLAKMDNLPKDDLNGKIEAIKEIIATINEKLDLCMHALAQGIAKIEK